MQFHHRTWLTALLLAAVLLRSLVADGYMPDEDGVVRLCTPEGMVAVVIDPDTGEAVEVEESLSAECPWAYAFFPGGLLSALPSLPARYAVTLSAADPARTPELLDPVGLPPARAPPISPC
ncbi:hypothetical protein [Wenzhouxiangella sp. EGI_FJ10305]|uniref:hypothetical protein n=1 Tax=Wenzhouxiangella sp. EGI_FJ10305 TaxID=3243768 RepID=UPI0035E07D60